LRSRRHAAPNSPALAAEQYVSGEQLLGVALSALMRATPERRAELHAEALKRIALSGENDWRRFLLTECVEAYADLDANERERLQALFATPEFQNVRPLMITTYERGKLEGKLETLREMLLMQLGEKFRPLPADLGERVARLSADQLEYLFVALIRAQSLDELQLPN
jgi:hypothetical protein